MRATLLLATFASLVAGSALADHPAPDARVCGAAGHAALGIVEVTAGTAASTVYLDDRNWLLGNGIWHYAETNGVWEGKPLGVHLLPAYQHDLQRGPNVVFIPDDHEDPCVDAPGETPDAPFPLL